jgi:hypothetical protein
MVSYEIAFQIKETVLRQSSIKQEGKYQAVSVVQKYNHAAVVPLNHVVRRFRNNNSLGSRHRNFLMKANLSLRPSRSSQLVNAWDVPDCRKPSCRL